MVDVEAHSDPADSDMADCIDRSSVSLDICDRLFCLVYKQGSLTSLERRRRVARGHGIARWLICCGIERKGHGMIGAGLR